MIVKELFKTYADTAGASAAAVAVGWSTDKLAEGMTKEELAVTVVAGSYTAPPLLD